jgi:hypothetical protein
MAIMQEKQQNFLFEIECYLWWKMNVSIIQRKLKIAPPFFSENTEVLSNWVHTCCNSFSAWIVGSKNLVKDNVFYETSW